MNTNLINFDNAATTFPKPPEVRNSVIYAMNNYGGSSGRGGHILSSRTSEMVFRTRNAAAEFFGADTENLIFCSSCTHALNTAIKGVLRPGDHVITSSLEHNSVIRPLYELQKRGLITFSVAKVYDNDEETAESFRNAVNSRTRAIVCTAASNVTGQILPLRLISEICRKNGLCFIADGAQACGVIPLSLKEEGINILCTSGHKGLYGISGTGLLVSDGKYKIHPLMQGGTGSGSLDPVQPEYLPDALESGTLNTCGIASLEAGLNFVSKYTVEKIKQYEDRLVDIFLFEAEKNSRIKLYRPAHSECVPIVSFNIADIPSDKTAEILSSRGFCLRAGFHCSAMAHRSLGTETGTVRFAPSVFNSEADVKKLCQEIKKIL